MSTKRKKVVAVSGGFDPIHIGHLRMFKEAKKLGDKLVVIINGDSWLTRKKGAYFMTSSQRAEIIKAFKYVDDVYVHNSKTNHVAGALKNIKPDIFANGGDRKNIEDIPEGKVCEQYGIKMVFNVGGGKVESSSDLLFNYCKKVYLNKDFAKGMGDAIIKKLQSIRKKS